VITNGLFPEVVLFSDLRWFAHLKACWYSEDNMPQSTSAPDKPLTLTRTRWEDTGIRFFPFHVVLGVSLAIPIFIFMRKSMADPDIWWHFRNAQYLLAHHRFPLVDEYSFTAAGASWLPHEWLSEVFYYFAFRVAGLRGVFFLALALIEAIMLGLFYIAYRKSGDIKNSFLATAFAVLLATVSIGPRTLLFGWLCMLVLLNLLRKLEDGEEIRIWVIPALFCLWVNLHGSWLMGMVVFGIVIASGLVEGSWGQLDAVRWAPRQLRRLLITAGASLGALFANPCGYRIVFYPFDLAFRQKMGINHVDEWMSIDFHTPRGKLALIFLLTIILLAVLSPRRWKLNELLFVFLGLYMSLTYVRLLFLGALLITPILASHIKLLPPYQKEIDKPALNCVILTTALVFLLIKTPGPAQLENKITSVYPVRAVEYMKSHSIRGRMLNEYLWGGYLIWNNPDLPVFIDGRADIFDHTGVFKDYMAAVSIQDSFAILDKYHVNLVLVSPGSATSYLLKNNSGWNIKYQDDMSVLFEKR